MSVPASIALDQASARQNFALGTIKASAERDQAIAQILDQSIRSAPISQSRGTNVNTSA